MSFVGYSHKSSMYHWDFNSRTEATGVTEGFMSQNLLPPFTGIYCRARDDDCETCEMLGCLSGERGEGRSGRLWGGTWLQSDSCLEAIAVGTARGVTTILWHLTCWGRELYSDFFYI